MTSFDLNPRALIRPPNAFRTPLCQVYLPFTVPSSMGLLNLSASLLAVLSTGPALLCISLGLIGLLGWKLRGFLILPYTTKLRNLPGPPTPSWIFGNLKVIQQEANSVPQERWSQEYRSHTIVYRGLLYVCTPMLSRAVLPTDFRIDTERHAMDSGYACHQPHPDTLYRLSEAGVSPQGSCSASRRRCPVH